MTNLNKVVSMTYTELPKVKSNARRARIFISYKRNVEPDESVVREIFQALTDQQHDVFIDQTMLVGARWAQRIEDELSHADFFIPFLSAESIQSEMVLAEIETAHRLAKDRERPTILPVRLAYREPFSYPLSAYLNPLNWAFWQSLDDTPHIIEELLQAISGGTLLIDEHSKASFLEEEGIALPAPRPSAQRPVTLETPDGTMDPQSVFYVERNTDQMAMAAIGRQGVTITIKAPRQMGKSSLLMRLVDAATKANKRVAFLDFQLFAKSALAESDIFFRQFCAWLTDELGMDDRVDDYWNIPLGNPQLCTRYMSRYLLKELGRPMVLVMDEVESLFEADFRSDFFGMLRSWHNNRRAGSIWKQLDLALVTSTEPYQLIDNLNQSPFNVGEVIELTDFTRGQITDLNRRHGSSLSINQEQQLMTLVGGHPYLVRRALYLVASQRISANDLFAHAADDHGPFGDHLRHHLFRLHQSDELFHGMRQVIQNERCQNEQIFFRLQGAGLVRRDNQRVIPRYQLYADFFLEHLHV
jgi:AAA-like domain/TIR domain